MAEFCLRCSIDLFGEDSKDLVGIAKEGYVVAVLCEDCGIIYVDHEGKCRTACSKDHYTSELELDRLQNCTNENPTSKIPREHSENPTSES